MKQFVEFVNGLDTIDVEPVSFSYMNSIAELILEEDLPSSMYEIERELKDSEEIDPLP